MKTINFSRKSLGYKFLCNMDSKYRWRPPTDICSYGRALLCQSLKLFLIIGVITAFCFLVGGMIVLEKTQCVWFATSCKAWLIPEWQKWLYFIGIGFTSIASLIGALLAVAFTVMGIFEGTNRTVKFVKSKIPAPKYEPVLKEPNTVVKAYRAWKEKTCYRIRFD